MNQGGHIPTAPLFPAKVVVHHVQQPGSNHHPRRFCFGHDGYRLLSHLRVGYLYTVLPTALKPVTVAMVTVREGITDGSERLVTLHPSVKLTSSAGPSALDHSRSHQRLFTAAAFPWQRPTHGPSSRSYLPQFFFVP